MNTIEIQHLQRHFTVGDETVRALDDVSFSIAPGEFVSIMGTSGSGKSTLLNSTARTYRQWTTTSWPPYATAR